jgi:SAM-dependent methyltransferase
VPVVVGDMTRMPFREGAFDGITSGETLEHLPDDAAAAGEIARVLREGGLCVATVPARETLHDESKYDQWYGHLRRYSRESLSALFTAKGLRIEKVHHWGFPVVLLYDSLFMMPMNLKRSKAPGRKDAALTAVARAGRSRLLVRLVQAIFATDRLFRWLRVGPGLLVVAIRG